MSARMRAAMLDEPFKIGVVEVEVPSVGSEDVLIRVKAAGICGSDLHAYRGVHPFRKPPVILGHEMAGVVVEVGKDVREISPGDRVTVEPQLPCRRCEYCIKGLYQLCNNKAIVGVGGWLGTFAEFFLCHQDVVYKLPEDVSFLEGALVEPLSVGIHAVRRARVCPGDKVAVLGGGTIGLTTLAVARQAGAGTLVCTDVVDFNLEVAKKLGATHVVNTRKEDLSQKIAGITDAGMDIAIITAGFPQVFQQALSVVRKGGLVLVVAMFDQPVEISDMGRFLTGEQNIAASWLYRREDFQAAIEMLALRRIDVAPLITHTMPLDEVARAFELMDKRTARAIKIVLSMGF